MDILVSGIKILFQAGLVILLVFSLFHWIRTGFWVPRYIHFAAVCSMVVAALLAYGEFSSGGGHKMVYLVLVIGFPLSVYLIYGIYGGGFHSKELRINQLLSIDRAMDKDEALSLLKEQLGTYKEWSYENLLILSANGQSVEITSGSGRRYKFTIQVNARDDRADDPLQVVGILTDLGKRFYRPRSWAMFLMNKRGEVIGDGLKNY